MSTGTSLDFGTSNTSWGAGIYDGGSWDFDNDDVTR